MTYDNIRNTMPLLFSRKDGNFTDEYYQDKDGKTYRASFYCNQDKPFCIAQDDITGTIPKFGEF